MTRSIDFACAFCHSTDVKVVSSYETRQVAVIRCLQCGKVSEFDTEHMPVERKENSGESDGPMQEDG